jgi:hypothetical protein
MVHRLVGLALAGAILAFSPAALADGVTIGYGDDCWYTGTDADGDGLNDDCERQLAEAFNPHFWFHSSDGNTGRLPHFAVKNISYATRTVWIFYMNAYFQDTHWLTGHDGDPEFQVLQVSRQSGNTWVLDAAFASQHRYSSCDSSTVYNWDELRYEISVRGQPRFYIAKDKHAAFARSAECRRGCSSTDTCSKDRLRLQSYHFAGRNVGGLYAKLVDCVWYNGERECLLQDREFKGWHNTWWFNSKGYYRHLVDFEIWR